MLGAKEQIALINNLGDSDAANLATIPRPAFGNPCSEDPSMPNWGIWKLMWCFQNTTSATLPSDTRATSTQKKWIFYEDIKSQGKQVYDQGKRRYSSAHSVNAQLPPSYFIKSSTENHFSTILQEMKCIYTSIWCQSEQSGKCRLV